MVKIDKIMKTNIRNIEHALGKSLLLQGVEYSVSKLNQIEIK
jgi:hypothetical protein